jgi:tRNA-2-methylthio-N6-dimethylallyladenosine synthase
MNENDSQIVAAILQREGFSKTSDQESAEVVLLNTCAIRANAESKILTRLGMLRAKKHERPDLVIGILGCMAERLKQSLWEQGADIVAGPDSYRNLPAMLAKARQ